MTNLNEITYVDWQLKLNSIGEVAQGVDDINQCIAIILLTKKGTVPHRPTFGSDIYKYIDYPINEAVSYTHLDVYKRQEVNGHADRFWALALALIACSVPYNLSLIHI